MSGENPNAFCSFCRKSYRDIGPLVEGPGEVYICGECVELCQSIIEQEKKRRGTVTESSPDEEGHWVDSLHNYFLEGVLRESWKTKEIPLLREIGIKIDELKTLVAGRSDSHGSA